MIYPTRDAENQDDLDEARCSCGFPETNFECESLLSDYDSTEAPSDVELSSEGVVVGGGDEAENTPTWVIITAIAMVVLVMMTAYGAVLCKRRLAQKKAEGVDDFFS